MVFSYLEGRNCTEVLAAGFSLSFIIASGAVKSISVMVMESWGVSEQQMPYITGALFLLPFVLSVWMLDQLPLPTERDEANRTKRIPMNAALRWQFYRNFALGISTLVALFMLLMSFRDLRGFYMVELLRELGYKNVPALLTVTELLVTIFVLAVLASLALISNNARALIAIHYVIGLGFVLVGVSAAAFQAQLIAAPVWIVLMGMGIFMGFVPFSWFLFERLIATFRASGNAEFGIYLIDALGYSTTVFVLLYKNISQPDISWVSFFIQSSYLVAFGGIFLTAMSAIFFKKKMREIS